MANRRRCRACAGDPTRRRPGAYDWRQRRRRRTLRTAGSPARSFSTWIKGRPYHGAVTIVCHDKRQAGRNDHDYRDSFTTTTAPFPPMLVEHVGRVVWQHHKSCGFDWKLIDRFQPDEVWWMPTERLFSLRHQCPPGRLSERGDYRNSLTLPATACLGDRAGRPLGEGPRTSQKHDEPRPLRAIGVTRHPPPHPDPAFARGPLSSSSRPPRCCDRSRAMFFGVRFAARPLASSLHDQTNIGSATIPTVLVPPFADQIVGLSAGRSGDQERGEREASHFWLVLLCQAAAEIRLKPLPHRAETRLLDFGAKRNALKRSAFERPFQARQSRLGMAS